MSTSSSAKRKRVSPESTFPYMELNSPRRESGNAPQVLEQERQQREAAAREVGKQEAQMQASALFAAQIEELRAGIAVAIDQFSRERHEYYLRVEREVVQLALSIARKILHRESNVDPLLLAGMVRVLLERMEQSTKVTVRVHPTLVSEFRTFFARHLQEKLPEVIEDATLTPERCVLVTELGTTEVGPEVQLKEIEQGLLDLEAARPHIRS